MWEDNQSSRNNRVERNPNRYNSNRSYYNNSTYRGNHRYITSGRGGRLSSIGTIFVIILVVYMAATGQFKDIFNRGSSYGSSLYEDANRQLRHTGEVVFIDRYNFAMYPEQFDYFVDTLRSDSGVSNFKDNGSVVTFDYVGDGKKFRYTANYNRSNNILNVLSKDRGSYDIDISLTGKFLGFLR